MSLSQGANQFGISTATVGRIMKRKEEYQAMQLVDGNGFRKRKFRQDATAELNTALWSWVNSQDERMVLNGPELKTQALILASEMNLTTFKASNGWLDAFRNRFKKQKKETNKKVSFPLVKDEPLLKIKCTATSEVNQMALYVLLYNY